MDCSEFEIQLAEQLDHRQDLQSSGLHVHAESCESCKQLLSDATLLLRGVAAWRQPLPHFDLLERVSIADLTRNLEISPLEVSPTVEKLVVRKPVDRVRNGFLAWALVGTSAAALCFMFGSAAFQPNSPSGQLQFASRLESQVADQAVAEVLNKFVVPANAPELTEKPDLETVIASAGHAYSHLAEETAAAAQDFALLVPSKSLFTSSAASGTENTPAPTNSNPMFPGNVYPVGDSVENALQFLWKSVPGMDKTTG